MTARRGSIKVILDGRGPVTLRETDYVTAGGEGSIYRTGQTVVKIYTDADKMRRDGMADKVGLLAGLRHRGIVAPQGLVLDGKRNPIGFYMPFVDGEPLSRVFVSDYRARIGFADKDAIVLAASMHEIVGYAHAHKALMVDANELNWLVGFAKGAPASASVIDVDSWAIGRWPATVIMPSIRDWNAKTFTPATDWFAWGIVAFQVFTGIHPFKGKLDGYKPGDMIQRMKDNASVFAPGVRLPHSVRDFSCIPGPLLDWFRATFQQGVRSGLAPPSPLDTSKPARAARVARAVTAGATGALIFDKLFERVVDPAVRIWANGAVRLESGAIADLTTGRTFQRSSSADCEIVKCDAGWLVSDRTSSGEFFLVHISDDFNTLTHQSLGIAIRRVFRAGERLFAVTDRELVEIECRVLAGHPQITVGRRWSIMVKSTTWLDDIAVQDVLGAAFAILPRDGGVHQIRVPELDDAVIIAGKASARFAAFTTLDRQGNYQKLELSFDKTFTTYQPWIGPADSAELNMGILPRGVVATVVTDGELAIVVPSTGETKKVADRGVTTAMKLAAWGEKIVYLHDGAVWQLRMSP